jgi:pimeloyl-ACP methyl ester carboxylesterase
MTELGIMLAYGVVALLLTGVLVLAGSWLFSKRVSAKIIKTLPPNGRKVPVSGSELHIVEAGQGRAIVMLHGLTGNLHNFTYALTEPLSKDFRVIAIDRPGCGHSTRDNDEHARLPEQARMIAEFLDAEGIENPLIVGHSLGGTVALAMALDFPEQVGGLALIAPLTGLQTKIPSAFRGISVRGPMMRRLIAETLAIPGAMLNGSHVARAIFGPDSVPEDFSMRGGGLLSVLPSAYYAAATDVYAVPLDLAQQIARYKELKMPIGMLFGDADGVLQPAAHIAAIRDIRPDLDLQLLENTGHMPLVSQAAATEAFIRRIEEKTLGRSLSPVREV